MYCKQCGQSGREKSCWQGDFLQSLYKEEEEEAERCEESCPWSSYPLNATPWEFCKMINDKKTIFLPKTGTTPAKRRLTLLKLSEKVSLGSYLDLDPKFRIKNFNMDINFFVYIYIYIFKSWKKSVYMYAFVNFLFFPFPPFFGCCFCFVFVVCLFLFVCLFCF